MLVAKLYEVFANKICTPEKPNLECPRIGEGIWDTLGYYDSEQREISICEREIAQANHNWDLAKHCRRKEHETALILRELVRLHEHAHALHHTGNFVFNILGAPSPIKVRRRFVIGYENLPKEIIESLAEFISWSVVSNINVELFNNAFNKVDEHAEDFYKKWKTLRELIKSRFELGYEYYIAFVPGLINITRQQELRSFDDFTQAMQLDYNKCKRLAEPLIMRITFNKIA